MAVFLILPAIGFFSIIVPWLNSTPFERGRNPIWWAGFFRSAFLTTGAAGFLGNFALATGALTLPASLEWPMGNVAGVIRTIDGVYLVPHTPSGRIQVYDDHWNFQRGWNLGTGGLFKLFIRERGRFHVVTARGRWHYVFDYDGRERSKESYEANSYDGFPNEGESVAVPTKWWLWTFSSLFLSWALMALGMLFLMGVLTDAKKQPKTPAMS
jgi:hypothetical protein